MAVRNIVLYPQPVLRATASEVETFDDELQQLVDDMIETMDAAPGIGLAAPQVGISKRIFVCDISKERNERHVFINPRIVSREGETTYEEGCLSLPFIYAEVKRADIVTVEAHDTSGKAFTLEADGLLSICIQHELDHLDGRLFIDHLSRLKRDRLLRQMKKKIAEAREEALEQEMKQEAPTNNAQREA